ncbi:MAG: DUF3343 domain-containing protein [Pelovirga sp.]
MIKEGDCVAIFHSVHRVLQAEKVLKADGYDICLIPVPRQLSADCGLAIRFARQSHAQIESSLARADLAIAEIWVMESGEYRPVR